MGSGILIFVREYAPLPSNDIVSMWCGTVALVAFPYHDIPLFLGVLRLDRGIDIAGHMSLFCRQSPSFPSVVISIFLHYRFPCHLLLVRRKESRIVLLPLRRVYRFVCGRIRMHHSVSTEQVPGSFLGLHVA
jgi:hypothetical protein